MRIFTIGYEGTTMDEFLAALKAAGVERLIDVRALPLSRRPGFSKSPLRAALEEVGIKYVHLKDFKGGKFVPLGEGQLNFTEIFSALKEMHYDGWVTVELDGYLGNPREAAEKSRLFIEAGIA